MRRLIVVFALVCASLSGIASTNLSPALAAYVSTKPPVYDNNSTADPQSTGSIALYDADGIPVVEGSLSTLGGAVYAVASNLPTSGATQARLVVAAPNSANASSAWDASAISSWTDFPVSGSAVPTVVSSSPNAVVTLNGSKDGNLTNFLASATLDSISGYAGYLQLRLEETGPGLAAATTWATLEIAYDQSAGTWRQVFPVPSPVSTSISTPTFSPSSPVASGASTTLSAVVTPPRATGIVHFFDGSIDLGSANYSNGVAELTTSFSNTNAQGNAEDHAITAAFTATGLYQDSASTAATLSISFLKATTTTNLTLSANTVTQPSSLTATAVVTSPGATVNSGAVGFYIDPASPSAPTGNPSWSAVPTNGSVTYTIDSSLLSGGDGCGGQPLPTHTVVAVYKGDALFASSTSSPAATFTVQVQNPSCTAGGSGSIQTTIPPGTLAITTGYSSSNPLTLPAMTLNPDVNEYSSAVALTGLTISDTRPGNVAYTVSVIATNLDHAGVSAPDVNQSISAQNLGLDLTSLVSTNATPNTFLGSQTPGTATGSQNFTGFNNPSASHVLSSDLGSLGLGGLTPHPIFHANFGLGSTEVAGKLTLNAPTNVVDGTYTGTLTFSILGS